MNPIATAQYGLFAASQRFEASAQRTAMLGDPNSNVDLAVEVVEQISASTAFKANISVIKTADEMQQSLLDILV
jgi:flagellar hook protein FlgE